MGMGGRVCENERRKHIPHVKRRVFVRMGGRVCETEKMFW